MTAAEAEGPVAAGRLRVILELAGAPPGPQMTIGTSDSLDGGQAPEPRSIPELEGVTLDRSYPPVTLARSGSPAGGPADSLEIDVSEEAPAGGDLLGGGGLDAGATYLVRGVVDTGEDLASLRARLPTSVVGVFSDPLISSCMACTGDSAAISEEQIAEAWRLAEMRQRGMDGSGVVVALVDTGFNLAFLQTNGKTPKTPTLDPDRSWAQSGSPPGKAPVEHGTMCAYDIAVAAGRCTLLDMAVDTGFPALISDVCTAFSKLLDLLQRNDLGHGNHSLVINNSWSLYRPSDDPTGDFIDNPLHPVSRLADQLQAGGADLVFASGNCGPVCPDDRCNHVTTRAIYGTNSHPHVLCVGAADLSLAVHGFSSQGPGHLSHDKPDVCAFSHFSGSGVFPVDSGTSAAAALTSGLIAAIRSKFPFDPTRPETSPEGLRARLRQNARKPGGAVAGWDQALGFGVIDPTTFL